MRQLLLAVALLTSTSAFASGRAPIVLRLRQSGDVRTPVALADVKGITLGDRLIPADVAGGRQNPNALLIPAYRVTLTSEGAAAAVRNGARNPLEWETEAQPADGTRGAAQPSDAQRTVRVDIEAKVGETTLWPHQVDQVTGAWTGRATPFHQLNPAQQALHAALSERGFLPLEDMSPNGLEGVQEHLYAQQQNLRRDARNITK